MITDLHRWLYESSGRRKCAGVVTAVEDGVVAAVEDGVVAAVENGVMAAVEDGVGTAAIRPISSEPMEVMVPPSEVVT